MRKCAYCDKEELCGVGVDNIPVCEDHYGEYLNIKRQEIEEAFQSRQRPSIDTTGAGAQGPVTTPSEPAPEEL